MSLMIDLSGAADLKARHANVASESSFAKLAPADWELVREAGTRAADEAQRWVHNGYVTGPKVLADFEPAVEMGFVDPIDVEHCQQVEDGMCAVREAVRNRHELMHIGRCLTRLKAYDEAFAIFAKVEAGLTRFQHVTSGGEGIRRFYWDWALCSRLRDTGTCVASSTSATMMGDSEHGLLARAIALGVWEHPLQYPLWRFARGVQHRNFWEVEQVPAARALRDSFAEISEEFKRLDPCSDYDPYNGLSTCDAGQWSEYLLFSGGRRHAAHCNQCPVMASVIMGQPSLINNIIGQHFLSRLTPGSHLKKHCGPSNLRLRVHLALKVPTGKTTYIEVGGERRYWEEGEILIFDDSIEHEVWHDGSDDRVVLICDCWHPDLTDSDFEAILQPHELKRMRDASNGIFGPIYHCKNGVWCETA